MRGWEAGGVEVDRTAYKAPDLQGIRDGPQCHMAAC